MSKEKCKKKKYLNKMHSGSKNITFKRHLKNLSLKSTTSTNKALNVPSFRLINKKRILTLNVTFLILEIKWMPKSHRKK